MEKVCSSSSDQSDRESNKTRFYKLPYIILEQKLLHYYKKNLEQVQKKFSKICKQFCKDENCF